MSVNFRPHHFLCALCFQGNGYDQTFVANFKTIMARLHAPDGDDTRINIVASSDSICAPCPHRRGASCATAEKIQHLDSAHAEALGISAGQSITWGEAKLRIAQRLSLQHFDRICASCEWKSTGICEKVLREHLAS